MHEATSKPGFFSVNEARRDVAAKEDRSPLIAKHAERSDRDDSYNAVGYPM
jgi:hypothetical protein